MIIEGKISTYLQARTYGDLGVGLDCSPGVKKNLYWQLGDIWVSGQDVVPDE